MEPSNIYPSIDSKNEGTLHDLLDVDQADTWNQKLSNDTKAYDHDKAVWDSAKGQLKRHLLSGPLTKQEPPNIFGKGRWRGIRRRGILQNDKVRGIDNARSSGTNFAAWLQDTIMTSPHDIAMQILCWMFSGEHGKQRFRDKSTLWVGLSADDLADAYHGVPNIPSQMNLRIVALRNPHSGVTEFYVSRTHLFGLSAAVVNFNRLPQFMTAVCSARFPVLPIRPGSWFRS